MSHRQVLLVLSGLMLGMFLAALDQSVVGTALKTIVTDLGGANHVSWVVAAYLIAATATTPLYGKLSDLYGRRPVYQFAIVIFLAGSALAGISQHMWELILFRGIQGLGGGGLISLAMTIVGDIVSPRERGRYQGYFGATFALAAVAGPLLGGFFTDQLSWHWIFYINIPIGVLALIVVTSRLNIPFVRREHSIDYLGATVLVAAVSSILLVAQWGGTQYPWDSPQVLGLIGISLVLLAAFIYIERRAKEPILPLRLFRNRTFRSANVSTFIIASAMFGIIIYIPFYLQLVRGESATEAGLLMVPLMAGILTASITTGRIISRIGRFKMFPVGGTLVMATAMFLLSGIKATTSLWQLGGYLVLMGLGLGSSMQPLVLAVQNDSDPRELGVSTSSVTFFRSLGGSFGAALFGAVVTAGASTAIRQLPNGQRISVINPVAYSNAVGNAALVAVPLLLIACISVLSLREVHLRTTSGIVARGEGGSSGAAQQRQPARR